MERLDGPSLHLKESLDETLFFALWGLEQDDLLFTSVEVVQLRQGRQLFCIPKIWVPLSYPADVTWVETCGNSLGFASESDVEKVEALTWSENLGVTDALMELLWDTISAWFQEENQWVSIVLKNSNPMY